MRCVIHNRDMLKLGGNEVCPACLAATGAPAQRLWAGMAQRRAAQALHGRMVDAGIPGEFQSKTFCNFVAETDRARKACDFLRDYSMSFDDRRQRRKGFLLIGQPGTAKSHLACAMVRAIVEGGRRAAYVSLPRLTRDIRAAYGRPRGVDELLRRLVSLDFLVLDEIDLHGTSDNDYNMLYDVINGRYEQVGHPTLAISNRNLEHLQADLDERVVSRILAGTPPIMCDWPPRRDTRRDAGAAR